MTDFSKYDGCTEGPLVFNAYTGDIIAKAEKDSRVALICNKQDCRERDANGRLFADAPVNLAKFKAAEEKIVELEIELKYFRQFVNNGVELGYIYQPEPPDNAFQVIRASQAGEPLKLYHPFMAAELNAAIAAEPEGPHE